jgi:3-hydroxyisobutyrate dehydrogenase-like beta-hydroxyacid dehydrogenase
MVMEAQNRVGFVGLGVMGEPMCRNLAAKHGGEVIGYDVAPEPLEALAADGVVAAASVAELVGRAEVVFLSLPGDGEVREVCLGKDGISSHCRPGQAVVDCSTTTVGLSQELGAAFASQGVSFADAPVARTREAAERGALSVMVGGAPELLERIRPLLDCFAAEVTHCGGVGSGQAVKLLNNMVLFQTVQALAEALTVGRKAGLDGRLLFETLAKGSADSFALRNHGMKALLPGRFPERSFSTRYAIKDLSCALALGQRHGVALEGAALVMRRFEESLAAGHGDVYFPALIEVVESDIESGAGSGAGS